MTLEISILPDIQHYFGPRCVLIPKNYSERASRKLISSRKRFNIKEANGATDDNPVSYLSTDIQDLDRSGVAPGRAERRCADPELQDLSKHHIRVEESFQKRDQKCSLAIEALPNSRRGSLRWSGYRARKMRKSPLNSFLERTI